MSFAAAAAVIAAKPIDTGMRRFLVVGRTVRDHLGQYPSVAAGTFEIELFQLEEPRVDGAAPTLTRLGERDLAVNLGLSLPPPGTLVFLGKALSGRYIFNHNG